MLVMVWKALLGLGFGSVTHYYTRTKQRAPKSPLFRDKPKLLRT